MFVGQFRLQCSHLVVYGHEVKGLTPYKGLALNVGICLNLWIKKTVPEESQLLWGVQINYDDFFRLSLGPVLCHILWSQGRMGGMGGMQGTAAEEAGVCVEQAN